MHPTSGKKDTTQTHIFDQLTKDTDRLSSMKDTIFTNKQYHTTIHTPNTTTSTITNETLKQNKQKKKTV